MVLSFGSRAARRLACATALTFVIAVPALAQSAGAGASGGASAGAMGAGVAGDAAASSAAPAAPSAVNAVSQEGGTSGQPASMTAGETSAVSSTATDATGSQTPASTEASAASAEPATDAEATAQMRQRMQDACMAPPAKLGAEDVAAYLSNPSDLLATYGGQALTLSNRVRTLAGSDGRTLDPIFGSVAQASDDQKAAIGAGLGRAAFMCQGVNPDYAADIQSRIADLDAPALLTAFLTATNDLQVAAIGGGASSGAAGAPGLSGGGLAGPGTAGLGGDDTTPNLITTYASSGSRGTSIEESRGSSSNLTINIFGSTPVSPTVAN